MAIKQFNSVDGYSTGNPGSTFNVIDAAGNITASGSITRNSRNVPTVAHQANTPPSSPLEGDQWYNTTTGVLFEYLNDGTSSQWVDVSGLPGVVGPIVLPGGTANAVVYLNSSGETVTSSSFVFDGTNVTAPRFTSTVATGTAPFTVTSTTQVANLNAATAGSATTATTAGTVTTAAQGNITSVGTLTGLTVSGNTFLATSSGAVGIGTSSPGYRLDVASADTTAGLGYALRIRGNATAAAGAIQFTDSGVTTQWGFLAATATEVTLGASGSSVLAFRTNSNERMRIDSGGNVGIGTSSPGTYNLNVAGSLRAGDTIDFGNAGTNPSIVNIGVGATGNRLAIIDLIGDTTYTDYGFRILRGDGGPNTGSLLLHRGTGALSILTEEAAPITFNTNATQRMAINPNGAVAIGGTSGDATLHIQQAYGGFNRLTQLSPSGISLNAFNLMAAKNSGGGDNWWSWGVRTDAVWCLVPGVDSNLNSATGIYFNSSADAFKPGGGTWSATSDRTVKTNIAPITDAASRIMALKPSSFDYRAPEAHVGRVSDRGFIAQEFEQVYPHSVSESEMMCDAEKPFFAEGEKIKSVGLNTDFFADLIALVQEQHDKINTLEARLAQLEGN